MANELLRHIRIGGVFELKMWATARIDNRGQTIIAYDFRRTGSEEPIFAAEDFAGSPMHGDDSNEVVEALLGFLTLRPGDTDQDYFEEYTKEQMDFALSQMCETMQLEASEHEWEDLTGGN